MAGLRYSSRARADLDEITDRIIDGNGAVVAERIVARFERTILTIAEHPRSGRRRPRLGAALYSWPVRSWIIFYRIAADDVEIVRVLHGRRRASRRAIEGIGD